MNCVHRTVSLICSLYRTVAKTRMSLFAAIVCDTISDVFVYLFNNSLADSVRAATCLTAFSDGRLSTSDLDRIRKLAGIDCCVLNVDSYSMQLMLLFLSDRMLPCCLQIM